MKLVSKNIRGLTHQISHYQGSVRININNEIREFLIQFEKDNWGNLKIHIVSGGNDDGRIVNDEEKLFIKKNWDKLGIDNINNKNSGWVEVEKIFKTKIVEFDKMFKTKIKVLNYKGRRYSSNIIDKEWYGRSIEVKEINLQLDIDDVVLNVSYVSQYEIGEEEPTPNYIRYPGSIQVFHQNQIKRPSNIIVSQMIKENVIKLVDNIYEKLKLNFIELGDDDDDSIIGYEINI